MFTEKLQNFLYAPSLTSYQRRKTIEVQIGDVPLGGNNPIRVQSMTTTNTMDTIATVEQSIRMIEAGCEYVRITAPSIKEAENLKNIRAELRKRGYNTPIIADIHFTPNAAEIAARLVEKVRINPGNYVDKKRFQVIEYTDAEYEEEIQKIRDKFIPLLKICKEYGTAIRIGTNHGSLSDRIVNRYGDNPWGMVESALEFVRICEEMNFYNVVISMKSSNPQVMVQAYRLLVNRLEAEKLKPYPLHLGVTEAGDGEDGRIKSAVGIGTLLEDGLGDTIRVSLTEEPEFEIPVARKLVEKYTQQYTYNPSANFSQRERIIVDTTFNPFQYKKRPTCEVLNIGKDNVPRVIIDFSQIQDIQMSDFKAFGYTYLPLTDKWGSNDTAADFVYLGNQAVPFMMPNGLKAIQDYGAWIKEPVKSYPMLSREQYLNFDNLSEELNFLVLSDADICEKLLEHLRKETKPCVLVLETKMPNALQTLRARILLLQSEGIYLPVVIKRSYSQNLDTETLQLRAATDVGGLLIDGLGDGVLICLDKYADSKNETLQQIKMLNSTAFGILQAARTRMTRTEYISCPSCGRTLFDLQETTAMIRKRTDHLKGVKIAIMGCIVNGPGEMADADYGYVGSGKDRITLYRGQNIVKKNVPTHRAVDELIELIKEDNRWIEPTILSEVES
ncbi:MAG: (E)-4-hydroxy-3-methylbut-2-enyl-diphosphate synthase [Microscillaceae bacterium]|nr:(E)-4-hydroxy-3-methylbut-2-enyl-diphosphate synthase [Microscillaceae bacterium]MDW8460551.1 (E)-4-hydroxy-3-methylbut-2-enyl-diphosphate synthase [Cytophagales bacterium]